MVENNKEEVELYSEMIDVIIGYLTIYEDRVMKGMKANQIDSSGLNQVFEVVMSNIIEELEEKEREMINNTLSEAQNGSVSNVKDENDTN